MSLSLTFPLLLACVGIGMIAWEATGTHRRPLLSAFGFVIAVFAAFVRLASSGIGISMISTGLFEFGVAFLIGGAILLLRKGHARPLVVIGVGVILLALIAGRFGAKSDATVAPTNSLLVELGPDDDIAEIAGVLTQFGAGWERAFPTVSMESDEDLAQVYLISLPKGTLRKIVDKLISLLRSDAENVDFVEVNRIVALEPVPTDRQRTTPSAAVRLANDPLSASQWAMDAARVDGAHRLLRELSPARKAVVAILDTGVDARHEDIRGTFLASPASDDAHGHGTHCAGIAGAATNNSLGIASLNWEGRFVDVASYRALSSSGMGTVESIAQAIIDATTDGADVISMSLGDYAPRAPRVVAEAVEFALQRQVIVVAAAGNSNQDGAHHMPANIKGVIAVSAVDAGLRKASFSNTNTNLGMPIAAPGVNILSLVPNGEYGSKSGTSMATPLVAGLLGVMRSLQPALTAEEAYRMIHDSGQTVEDTPRVGRVIDAEAAVGVVAKTSADYAALSIAN